MKHRSFVFVLALAVSACLFVPTGASAAVTSSTNATSIARAIAASPSQVLSASFVGQQTTANPGPAGIGNSAAAGFPTAGSTFGVLTTGNAENATAGDQSFFASTSNGVGPPVLERGTKAYDYVVLKIDVVIPPKANCASVDFRFLSEEFPDYISQGYNDSFLIEVDRSTWTAAAAGLDAPDDVAASSGQRITVDTLGISGFTSGAAAGTVYNGATPQLQAKFRVAPGKHSIYFSVMDQADPIYDSAVFLDNLEFTTAPDGTCSYEGAGDNTPAGLKVCGPVGTVLPPCQGLLPKPPKLVVCGPSFGTILKGCDGLQLGIGPKPFIGDAAWDKITVKCAKGGGSCEVEVDALLSDLLDKLAADALGLADAEPLSKKQEKALTLLSKALADSTGNLSDTSRAAQEIGAAIAATSPGIAKLLNAISGSLTTQVGQSGALIGLGSIGKYGVSKSLVDSIRDLLKDMSGTSSSYVTGNSQTAKQLAQKIAESTKKTISSLRAKNDAIAKAVAQTQTERPELPQEMAQVTAANVVQANTVLKDLDKEVSALIKNIKSITTKNQWGKQLTSQAADVTKLATFGIEAGNELLQHLAELSARAMIYGAGDLPGSLKKDPLATSQAALYGQLMTGVELAGAVIKTQRPGEKGTFSVPVASGAFGQALNTQVQLLKALEASLTEGSVEFPETAIPATAKWINPAVIGSQQTSSMQKVLGNTVAGSVKKTSALLETVLKDVQTSVSKSSTKASVASLEELVAEVAKAKKKAKRKKLRGAWLGSTSVVIPAGQTRSVKIRLPKQTKRLLKKLRSKKQGKVLKVKLKVRAKNGSGKTTTKTYSLNVGNGKKNAKKVRNKPAAKKKSTSKKKSAKK